MSRRVGKQFGNSRVVAVSESRKSDTGKYRYRFKLSCDACGHVYELADKSLGNATEPCPMCRAATPTQRTSTYHHPLYRVWEQMHNRCSNPSDVSFHRYGGRGIYVCAEWIGNPPEGCKKSKSGFDAFLADMGERPSAEHTIDRCDNDGPYNKENCRWATPAEQANNRQMNVWVEIAGRRKTMQQWITALNIDKSHVYACMRKNLWTHAQAIEYFVGKL